MKSFLYILKSLKNGNFYIGVSNNPEDRIGRHNQGRSRFTKGGLPWVVIFIKEFTSKSLAMKEENYLKRMKSRDFLKKYINNNLNKN